jgi:O-antigen/teichoic acid export membrane protein
VPFPRRKKITGRQKPLSDLWAARLTPEEDALINPDSMNPDAVASQEPGPSGPSHAERFFVNVIWTWLAVAASFFTGFFLSRYIVKSLGESRYGIWALTFAFVESFGLLDFGFRTAVVNFTSRLRARADWDGINEVVNTSLAYFLVIGSAFGIVTILLGGQAYRFFKINPLYQHDFSILVRLIGINWALGMVCSVFQAGMEAFHQFKAFYRISVSTLVLRSVTCVLVLYWGNGLVSMGVVVLATYMLMHVLTLITFSRVFHQLRFSPALISFARWKEMLHFGVHSFLATFSLMWLAQAPALLVGHFLSDAFVGFYTVPSRLFQYGVEMVTRIGYVTTPNTAELVSHGRSSEIVNLGMYLNRYCFALFLPFSIFLGIFGTELIRLWLGGRYAMYAGPLLLPFMLSSSLAIAGQFNSSSILYGLAKHAPYARSLMAEALLLVTTLWFVVPKYGITGAAWVTASLMILNRAVVTPYMLCRNLNFSFLRYMREIYWRALLSAIPCIGAGFWLKQHWVSGRNWTEVALGLTVICALYYAVALLICVEPEHRLLVRGWIMRRLRLRTAAA